MSELKLFKVYFLGDSPCWSLRVARSEEEALIQCYSHSDRPKPPGAEEKSCRAEEVKFEGYKLTIEKY